MNPLFQREHMEIEAQAMLSLIIIEMHPAQTDERIPDPLSGNHSQTARKVLRPPFSLQGPVRINADDQKKWTLVCYPAVIILAIIFLSLIAALALPQALVSVNEQEWVQGSSLQYCRNHLELVNSTVECAKDNTQYSTSGAFVSNLKALNQFLVLYLDIKPSSYRGSEPLNEVVNFTLYAAQRPQASLANISPAITVSHQISSKNISLVGTMKDVFRSDSLFILWMTKLSSSDNFYWELKFSPNSTLAPNSYDLNSQIVNANFSLFTIFLRVGLFIVAFAVFVKYNRLILLLPKERVSVEQRAIQVLSVVTLTFNDQLYFISVIAPNPFSSFLSSFFLWNFVAYLFIIWSLFLNRIRSGEPDTTTYMITAGIAIVAFLFYALVLGYTVAYAITQTTDHPVFSFEDISSGGVIAMEVIAFMVFSLACVYIIYLYCYTLKFKPNRLYRHNVFMGLSAAFFISTAVFFFVGGYSLFSYSASKIFFTLTFMNMYSFFLQYLYAPTQKEIRNIHREAAPLIGDLHELIQIPENGEVLVEILSITEKSEKGSEARSELKSSEILSEHSEQSKQSKEEDSLSARQRRKRNRKARHLNKSRENDEKGETRERIGRDGQNNAHDEFS